MSQVQTINLVGTFSEQSHFSLPPGLLQTQTIETFQGSKWPTAPPATHRPKLAPSQREICASKVYWDQCAPGEKPLASIFLCHLTPPRSGGRLEKGPRTHTAKGSRVRFPFRRWPINGETKRIRLTLYSGVWVACEPTLLSQHTDGLGSCEFASSDFRGWVSECAVNQAECLETTTPCFEFETSYPR